MRFTNLIYLFILVLSLICLLVVDRRWRLAVFFDSKASLIAIVGVATLLLGFDIIGINWEIFSTNQAYVSGAYILSKNLPIEELFLLVLISYTTLLIYQAFKRLK